MTDLRDEPTSAFDTIASELVFSSGRVIDVRTDQVAMPGGGVASRDVVVHPGAVGIVAMNDREEILLLRQYRHPVGRYLWEPPAGLLDVAGEDPLIAAKRELHEEAHLEAADWAVLIDAFTTPGGCDEAVRIYLARQVRESTQARYEGQDEEADMRTRWVPLPEAVDAVLTGQLHNPLAVMGVLATAAFAESSYAGMRPAGAPWPEMSAFPGSATAHRSSR
ncbi:MAG TPA: NUDIX hydrolase [Mycobacteriales bacterium]|nr:NUDIX hydrolase [Mycobacteriales bacterium]